MSFWRSFSQGWVRLREAARREFLRDPEVLLFEHVPAPNISVGQDPTHGR